MASPKSHNGSYSSHLTSAQIKRPLSRPLQTYSKRVVKDSCSPQNKRARLKTLKDVVSPLKLSIYSQLESPIPEVPKKRSISDFFKANPNPSTPTTPQSSTSWSDTSTRGTESLSSSPPLTSSVTSPVALQRTWTRRRLTTRPPLQVIMDQQANNPRKRARDDHKATVSVVGGPPPPVSFLSKTSPPGLRKAAEGGTSSEEDISTSSQEEANSDGIDFAPNSRRNTSEPIPIPMPLTSRHRRSIVLPPTSTAASHSGDIILVDFGMSSAYAQVSGTSGPTVDQASGSRGGRTPLSVAPYVANVRAGLAAHLENAEGNREAQPGQSGVVDSNPSGLQDVALVEGGEVDTSSSTGPQAPSQNTADSALILPGASVSIAAQASSVVALPSSILSQNPAVSSAETNTQIPPPAIGGSTHGNQGGGQLAQTQLALGVSPIIHCNVCDLQYNNTIQQDRNRHTTYHADFINGISVGSLNNWRADDAVIVWQMAGVDGHLESTVAVDHSSADRWKRLSMRVLSEHVDRELGSTGISGDRLWSMVAPSSGGPRFKVYLHISGRGARGRVVGLVLAEHISAGFETARVQVTEDEFGPWPAVVPFIVSQVSSMSRPALMGVNKLWVLRSERRRGIARIMVDAARDKFIFGMSLHPLQVAWTQTTEAGGRFATAYTGRDGEDYDYLTYDDDE